MNELLISVIVVLIAVIIALAAAQRIEAQH